MSEELLAERISTICNMLKEMKENNAKFQDEMRSEIAGLKECKHCTNAPTFREKFKTHAMMICTLGTLTGAFFLMFLAHIQGK